MDGDNQSVLALAKILDCRDIPQGLCLPEPYNSLAQAMAACPKNRPERKRALDSALAGMNGERGPDTTGNFEANPSPL